MARLATALAALALFAAAATACPFAGRRSLQAAAPAPAAAADGPAPGAEPPMGRGAFPLPGLSKQCSGLQGVCDGPSPPSWAEVIGGLKWVVSPGSDICYWSWQSLPPPGARAAGAAPFDYSGMPEGALAIQAMGYDAYRKFGREADPATCTFGCGAMEWGGVSFGGDLVRYLCATNASADPLVCTDAQYNQAWRWPMATTIWRFNGTNTEDVLAAVKEWRVSPEGHQPQITSKEATQEGWGETGALIAKLFVCDDIPEEFKNLSSPPPPLSAPGGPVTDAALKWWTENTGLFADQFA